MLLTFSAKLLETSVQLPSKPVSAATLLLHSCFIVFVKPLQLCYIFGIYCSYYEVC